MTEIKNKSRRHRDLINNKKNVLRGTFGTIKFKKSTEQIIKESDKELYNE